mgnify:CR=1 FL=1
MKRIGFLFDRIVERENLLSAYRLASRGKSLSDERRAFESDLENNLQTLAAGLRDGTSPVGRYRRFMIHDPKEREICAASFPERVLHHALMNVCGPCFEKWLIFDSYANREGKGQLRAVRRAREFAARNRWFLKCDIRKYFDSIPHETLNSVLARKFKDPHVLYWFRKLIASYSKTLGRGLPIGNLTSQYFANLYLYAIDRVAAPYVRYMDDFVFWSDDKDGLKGILETVRGIAANRLGLELKAEPFINRTRSGMDFLEFRVFPDRINLSRSSASRYFRRVRAIVRDCRDERRMQERLSSMTAFVAQADTLALRREKFRNLYEGV